MGSAHTPENPALGEMVLDEDGDPPHADGCDVCILFSMPTHPEQLAAWKEKLRRQAAEPVPFKRQPVRLTPADHRLLAVLDDDYRDSSEIARRLGCRVDSVGRLVHDARRRGAQIESRHSGGYRLLREQSA